MKKTKHKGGFIFGKSKKNRLIDNLCKYSSLEQMNNNPRFGDTYILELCPQLTGNTPASLYNLYNIPKYMINAGNSVYNNIKDSVNISKGGYRKNKKTRNKKTRKKKIRKNNR